MAERSSSKQKQQVPYDDLRQWMDEADKLGELRKVDGASWEEDIGLATELLQHDEKAPTVLFDNIPGVPPGYRVLVNFFGGKRMNMTLGFSTNLNKFELSRSFLEAYRQCSDALLPYEVVEDGPVLENIMTGDDVDITKFPTPIWHEGDLGRYIGTGSFNVTQDPEEGWVNTGTYRVMLHDEKRVGFYISPGKHGRIHRDKYMNQDQSMPTVIVIGSDPLTFLMASTEIPYGVCEYDIVGALRARPMQIVKGQVTGLPFPANAEIVLEGYVEPGNLLPEGPFGEWTGYYGSDIRDEPVLDIKAVYYRNDPIILGCPPQRPPEEQSRYRAVLRSALISDEVSNAGVPDVKAVWTHECGGSRLLTAISIHQRYPGHAKQAGVIASQCRRGAYAGRIVIVVDEDVDVTDLEYVMWAVCTRCDPATSINILTNAWSTPLDPRIDPKDKAAGNFTNSRAIIDACRPFHWREQFPKVNMPSPETAKKAWEKFSYLFE
jgi:4-hydroxy-3-polyprenylbenzoate decarboxylase